MAAVGRGRWSTRSLVGFGAFAALLLGAVAFAVFDARWLLEQATTPGRLDSMPTGELLKAENDVRTMLLQAVAGALFLATALFSWMNYQLSREGQITERFARAAEQLGSDRDPSVRVGGIYSLQRIARESPVDVPAIVDLLSVHIASCLRPRLPVTTAEGPPATSSADRPPNRPVDVAAALRVLSRIAESDRAPGGAGGADWPLASADLRHIALPGVDLRAACLRGTNLRKANLSGARLGGADLQGARLEGANLQGADLRRLHCDVPGKPKPVYLEAAELQGANLRHARLDGSHLQRARLGRGDCPGERTADLSGAGLRGVQADGAWLEGVDLSSADLRDARLRGAHLAGAVMTGALLQGADFTDAEGLDSAELFMAQTDARTLPPVDGFTWSTGEKGER